MRLKEYENFEKNGRSFEEKQKMLYIDQDRLEEVLYKIKSELEFVEDAFIKNPEESEEERRKGVDKRLKMLNIKKEEWGKASVKQNLEYIELFKKLRKVIQDF